MKVLDFGLAHAFGQRRRGRRHAGATWRRSSGAARPRTSGPTSSRSACCSTGCWPGELPFPDAAGRSGQGPEPAPRSRSRARASRAALADAGEGSGRPAAGRRGGASAGSRRARERPRRRRPRVAGGAAVRVRRLPSARCPGLRLLPAGPAVPQRSRARPTCASPARCSRRAVEIDPRYAPAHAGLAEGGGPAAHVLPVRDGDAAAQVADAASARALELDPGLAEAHAARGLTLFLSRSGRRRREREFEARHRGRPVLPGGPLLLRPRLLPAGASEEAARLCREANAAPGGLPGCLLRRPGQRGRRGARGGRGEAYRRRARRLRAPHGDEPRRPAGGDDAGGLPGPDRPARGGAPLGASRPSPSTRSTPASATTWPACTRVEGATRRGARLPRGGAFEPGSGTGSGWSATPTCRRCAGCPRFQALMGRPGEPAAGPARPVTSGT